MPVPNRMLTCATFSSKYHITVKQLQTFNTGLGSNGKNCKKLIPGKSYCTKKSYHDDHSPKKSEDSQKSQGADNNNNSDKNKAQGSGNGNSNGNKSQDSNSNAQTAGKSGESVQSSTGATNDASHLAARAIVECKKFHVVKAGETCKSIAKDNKIPEAQLTQLSKEKSKTPSKDNSAPHNEERAVPKDGTTVTPPPCDKLVVGKRYCIAY
ncbi:hypothetical protein CLU79DRAFT_484629 [Phycomyces nitens]|nr:hypothetical protein CLU79DRAFT_484629 [Phycomyces nitens]